jgi:glycosyltransferase involved in cell wall biosynthesis
VDPHPLFDMGFYLEEAPDVAKAGMNALVHFLRHGWKEGRNPHPLVDLEFLMSQLSSRPRNPLLVYCERSGTGLDPHPLFRTDFYCGQLEPGELKGQAPLVHYLTRTEGLEISPSEGFNAGRYIAANSDVLPMNPLYHFLRFGRREGRLSFRLDPLDDERMAMIMSAAEIEPLIVVPGKDIASYHRTHPPYLETSRYSLARAAGNRLRRSAYGSVLLLSGLRRGGAELEAMNILRHLLQREDVLVVSTDSIKHEALDWLPTSPRLEHVTFQEEVADASHDDRVHVLAHMLVALNVGRVINCNSHVGWTAYERYGRRLARQTRLEAMLFCYDRDINLYKSGYAPRFVGACIDHLAAIYIDNQAFIDELVTDFGLTGDLAARLKLLYHPMKPFATQVDRGALVGRIRERYHGRRPRVLWAGRPSRQKRVDLLVRIAESMPQTEFLCAGGGQEDFLRFSTPSRLPPNMTFVGGYKEFFDDLPLHSALAFLHTAAWEGLPNVLIDAVSAGLPVIATDVGGVRELIDTETGWLVRPDDGVAGFVEAVKAATTDAELVERKLAAASRRLERQHSAAAFAERLRELGFGAPSETGA